MNELKFKTSAHRALFIAGLAVVVAALGFGGYAYYRTRGELEATRERLATSSSNYELELKDLETNLSILRQENASLTDALREERDVNSAFTSEIEGIRNTVNQLDKLSRTDRELLKKYSKVYFLNENYIPASLTQVPPEYLSDGRKRQEIHTKVFPYLDRMIQAAEEDGVKLRVASGYRSYSEQAALKSNYTVSYGYGANRFSADQGYSEHQLGTTADFTTASSSALSGFDRTDGFAWLMKNAYKYGFVLSYPKGNAYYIYEPWHWRFVGLELAERLRDEEKNFYDMDQRVIDSYLLNLFD